MQHQSDLVDESLRAAAANGDMSPAASTSDREEPPSSTGEGEEGGCSTEDEDCNSPWHPLHPKRLRRGPALSSAPPAAYSALLCDDAVGSLLHDDIAAKSTGAGALPFSAPAALPVASAAATDPLGVAAAHLSGDAALPDSKKIAVSRRVLRSGGTSHQPVSSISALPHDSDDSSVIEVSDDDEDDDDDGRGDGDDSDDDDGIIFTAVVSGDSARGGSYAVPSVAEGKRAAVPLPPTPPPPTPPGKRAVISATALKLTFGSEAAAAATATASSAPLTSSSSASGALLLGSKRSLRAAAASAAAAAAAAAAAVANPLVLPWVKSLTPYPPAASISTQPPPSAPRHVASSARLKMEQELEADRRRHLKANQKADNLTRGVFAQAPSGVGTAAAAAAASMAGFQQQDAPPTIESAVACALSSTSGGDPYAVLGLGRGAPSAVVRKRYTDLCRLLHPDKLGSAALPVGATYASSAFDLAALASRRDADEAFKRVAHAYGVIVGKV